MIVLGLPGTLEGSFSVVLYPQPLDEPLAELDERPGVAVSPVLHERTSLSSVMLPLSLLGNSPAWVFRLSPPGNLGRSPKFERAMLSTSPRLPAALSATLGVFFFSWCGGLVDAKSRLGDGVPRREPGRMPRRALPNVLDLPTLLGEPSCERLGGVGLPLFPCLSWEEMSVSSRDFTPHPRRNPEGTKNKASLRT